MIPKVAHFFWANASMSWMRYMTIRSFCHFNPDWDVILHSASLDVTRKDWKSREVQEFLRGEPVEDWYPQLEKLPISFSRWTPPHRAATNPVYASDLFTWHLLGTEGGLYCDMDILFVKPMRDVLGDVTNADMWLSLFGPVFPIGFLAGCPQNRFFADLYRFCLKLPGGSYQSFGSTAAHQFVTTLPTYKGDKGTPEPRLFEYRLDAIHRHYGYDIDNLDETCVYPVPWNRIERIFIEKHPSTLESTFAIHWYAGSELSQSHNLTATPETLRDHDNTFSHFAKLIFDD